VCVVLLFCCGKSAGWKLLTQPALLPLRTLGYIVVYCVFVYRIVLLSVVGLFYFNAFFLLAVNFVIFSLRATILINLNLNLRRHLLYRIECMGTKKPLLGGVLLPMRRGNFEGESRMRRPVVKYRELRKSG